MQHVPWLRRGLAFSIAPVLQGFTGSAPICSCNCLMVGPLSLEDPTMRQLHEQIVFVLGGQESSQAWLAKTYELAFHFTSPVQSQSSQQRGSTSVPMFFKTGHICFCGRSGRLQVKFKENLVVPSAPLSLEKTVVLNLAACLLA